MANTNQVYGLQPVRSINGADNNLQVIACTSADATAIFNGDPVKLSGGCDANGLILVSQAAAGDAIFGVAVGFEADGSDLGTLYRKASVTTKKIFVNVDPNTVYVAQANAAVALADGCKNASIVVAAGSTTTGMSGVMVDNATVNTTATLQLHLLGFYNDLNNTPAATYNKVLVKINKSQTATVTTGV